MELTGRRRRGDLWGLVPVDQVHHLVTAAFPMLVGWTLFQENDLRGWIGVLSGLAQTVALTWGRRFPVAVLLVVIGIDLVTEQVGSQLIGFGVIIAGYYVAAWGKAWERSTALVLGIAFAIFTGILAGGSAALLGVIIGLGFLAFWVSGRFEAEQRGRITELSEETDRLAQERAVAEEQAADRERALLARELHDILNHSLTRIVLTAEAGAETGTESDARRTLRGVADTGRDSLAELRRLLGVLRTSTPDELRPPPSLDQVDELVAQIPPGGPVVTVERQGEVRAADTSIEVAAYRVVQEALTNVAKHAGAVRTTVRLTYLADTLEIVVGNELRTRNHGRSAVRGTGLVGLRERVELLGGTLHAGENPIGETSFGENGTHPNDDVRRVGEQQAAGVFTVYVTLPLRQLAGAGGGR
ncbi:signal transduction histidine kinase [Kribbella amoyensis]|uniref:histidine kinase n=1 Tax=Kribbella amoyensis TaxID=996641 RepID=A0A561BZ37_9ACTN|nr:signal transduction histidine kinase [Kribbella amoyensis]